MNIFSSKSGIVGEAPVAHLNRSLTEFFDLAKSIRVRLGKQAYLMDKYISYLLEAANSILATEASADGFEGDNKLSRICLNVLNHNDENKSHPMFERVKKFIDDHPLRYQEELTKQEIYLSLLANDWLRFLCEKQQEEYERSCGGELDLSDLRDLYRKICSLIDEDSMERLNLLFRQRFLIATPMQIYMQGLTNQLMSALTTRDRETQKQVFQILLDMGVGEA